MTLLHMIRRSLVHHARLHAAAVGGAAAATAVLVGALCVGDSVRATLQQAAALRVGQVRHALVGGDRFFMADLADRVGGQTASVIMLPAVAATPDGRQRINQATVLGVDKAFWGLAPGDAAALALGSDTVAVNAEAARRLQVEIGDAVVLRVDRVTGLSRDAALGGGEDAGVVLRLRVGAIVDAVAFGSFALAATPEPAVNLFVDRATLAEALEQPGRANLLLTAQAQPRELPEVLQLSDYQLALRRVAGALELTTPRVFLDAAVAEAIDAVGHEPMRVLTYFVNAIEHGEAATPYSTVTALSQPNPLFEGLRDDQIVINRWLADDLGAAVGDAITLRYFVIDAGNRLTEAASRFEVGAIVPMQGLAADPTLMPAFPGLHDAENCRDWEPGMPVDLDRIRQKDEAYWDAFRGTPKAFVTLAAGQAMWANRFGSLTAARWAEPIDEAKLLAALEPAAMGLRFTDLRGTAMAAATQGTDFASLFLGLSFFLIASALLLGALLFALNLDRRGGEVGVLLATGWPASRVRRLLIGEALALAAAGGALGAGLGVGFTQAVLAMLHSGWQGAMAGAAIAFAASPTSVIGGTVAGVLVSAATLAWMTRRMARASAVRLLSGQAAGGDGPTRRGGAIAWTVSVASLLGAAAMLTMAQRGGLGRGGQAASQAFFAAGGLLLMAALAAGWAMLRPGRSLVQSGPALAWRSATRRRGRSLAVGGLLACALFLVLAVGATGLAPPRDPGDRASGTGGFAFYGQTALPLLRDLASDEGREALGLDEAELAGVAVVPLRVSGGDDASCLSLTRAQRPRLIGVDPQKLAQRGAFTFVAGDERGWLALRDDDPDDAIIPGVADRNTLMWGLHASVGDLIDYTDEHGRAMSVRIVAAIDNSILQGGVLIDESAFVTGFPSVEGWRAMLVDAPPADADAANVAATLRQAMADLGLELTPAAERLARFSAVENTYRAIFQTLGALGLLLGAVAVGAVVMRNVLERRSELALLLAVGFTAAGVRRQVALEHAWIVGAGLAIGAAAATVAAAGHGILHLAALAVLAAVAFSALAWVWLAARLAVGDRLIDALRRDP